MNQDTVKNIEKKVNKKQFDPQWDRDFFRKQVWAIFIYAGMILFFQFLGFVLNSFVHIPANHLYYINAIFNFIFISGTAIILLFLMGRYYLECLRRFRAKYLLYGIGGYAVYFVLIIIWVIIAACFHLPPVKSHNQILLLAYFHAAPVITVMSAAFFAPFVEETVFRAGLLSVFLKLRLPKNLTAVTAVLFSGFIFGGLHFLPAYFEEHENYLELVAGVPYVIIGIILSFIYYKTRNVFASAFLHFLLNVIATLFILF